MNTDNDLYVLQYSESQGCFHIETVGLMLDKNLGIYLNRRKVDYIPLAIAATVDELRQIRERLISERDKVSD